MTIEKALEDIKAGKFVLVCDDKERENEADLIMSAEFVDVSHVNFMINHGKGLICAPMSKARAQELELPLMVKEHEGTMETAFTLSVDAKEGTHTGISSHDRAITLKALSDKTKVASDFARPGHIFPLIAWEGGVLKRNGHTEAAVDLMELSGLSPVAVICETLDEEGNPLKGETLEKYAQKHGIKIISILDLIAYKKSL